jgi:cytosine/adenosine deaminase-related metal-dependent hydrolase
VRYLDDLGVLDEKTLCVHAVDVADDDIDLLAARKSAVCLCPGSNRYLGVGKAPLQKYLDRGVTAVLGTDSLASNSTMSIWHEMRLLREDHPGVEPEKIFHMATLSGAKLLDLETISGAIAPGVSSSLLAIKTKDISPDDIFDFLTTVGENVVLEWIE